MPLLHLFQSFLPLRNPIGFGISDFLEFAVALLLVLLVLCRPWLHAFADRYAHRTLACMLLLAALPIALRLALLAHSPIPLPSGADDFSYILLGDTLTHFRLANPPHPLPQFFESIFTLQQPTYSSIFPLGQGIALALGSLLLALPWAGVALSISALCALSYWMLRAWVPPSWALLGGIFAVMEFGPLSQWMNSYWGGAVSGVAGCLVFGALPRLRRHCRLRYAALLGLGLAMQILTRPFESIPLFLCALVFLLPLLKTRPWRALVFVSLPVLAAVGLTLLQNKAVTSRWLTLPYMLSRYEYGVPTTFTFQPNPVPHRALTPEQDLDYRAQSIIHGDAHETLATYLQRLLYRIRYYRFFLLPPLYVALFAFLFTARQRRTQWILFTILLFALCTNIYPYFYPHYIAALTSLFLLIGITGLQRIGQLTWRHIPIGTSLSNLLAILCVVPFLFWWTLHLLGSENLQPAFDYESWNYINYGDPEGRIALHDRLTQTPGKQLVFVHYAPNHRFREWIHNAADIDASRIVWAHDLGPTENTKLLHYYPHRTAWLLQPDADPPELTRYNAAPPPATTSPFQSLDP